MKSFEVLLNKYKDNPNMDDWNVYSLGGKRDSPSE